MKDKILCSQCFGELEQTHHTDATYCLPCPVCSAERDEEVAYAAGDYVLDFAKEHFSSIVEEVYDKIDFSDGNDPDDIKELDNLLSEIVAKKSGVEKDLDLISIHEYIDI
jgi:hypothetical protein